MYEPGVVVCGVEHPLRELSQSLREHAAAKADYSRQRVVSKDDKLGWIIRQGSREIKVTFLRYGADGYLPNLSDLTARCFALSPRQVESVWHGYVDDIPLVYVETYLQLACTSVRVGAMQL